MRAGVYWIPAGRAISRNGRTPIVYKTEWAHVRQAKITFLPIQRLYRCV